MSDDLKLASGKFTFQVPGDRFYTAGGLWARQEGEVVRVGLSDFLQQRSGDVAFAEASPAGAWLAFGEEAARIETIKVDLSLGSPVSGRVRQTNPALDTAPEIINQDPYGDGWLLTAEPEDWEKDRSLLLDARAYFAVMKHQVELENKNP